MRLKLNKYLLETSQGGSFLQSMSQKPCFVTLRCFFLLLAFIVLLQNKHTTQNGENLISAQPRISAPSQGPKI